MSLSWINTGSRVCTIVLWIAVTSHHSFMRSLSIFHEAAMWGGLPTIYASPNQQNLKKVGLDQFLVTGSCELGLI